MTDRLAARIKKADADRGLELEPETMTTRRSPITHDQWAAIERHPRVVVGEWCPQAAALVLLYLEEGRPFSVVIGP